MKTKILYTIIVLLSLTQIAIGQATQANNVRPFLGTAFVGWDNTGTAGTLEIKNDFNSNINFLTNTTQKMTILAGGNVGINTTSPGKKLEVQDAALQLRLRYDGSNYCDMASNDQGELLLLPLAFNVGINLLNPSNDAALDISPDGSDDALRLRSLDANTSSTDILVDAGSGYVEERTLTNLITCGTPSQYSIPVFCSGAPQMKNSQIWDNGTYVIIGATSATYGTKFEVIQNANSSIPIFSSTNGTYSSAISSLATGSGSAAMTATGYSYGVQGLVNGAPGTGGSPIIGVRGDAVGTANTNGINMGTSGNVISATSTSTNYGLYGTALVNASGGAMTNYGVFGWAANGDVNWAGYFAGNLGVTGNTTMSGTLTVAGVTTINNNLAVNGNTTLTGVTNIIGTGFINGNAIMSDITFKKDIETITQPNDVLLMLNPVTYDFKTDEYPAMNFSEQNQSGFIAQEVELFAPELVYNHTIPAIYDTAGVLLQEAMEAKGLNYTGIIPYLVKGYQEKDAIISDLQSRLSNLEDQFNICCPQGGDLGLRSNGSDNDGTSNQSIELKSLQSPFLGQSVPNPHSTQATIQYFVPATEFGDAKIIFFDNLGREVNNIDILGRGQGQLTVMTSQLEDGVYTYSLVVNSKVIDTKKMVKAH